MDLFSQMDTDKDNFLSLAEFTTGLRKLCPLSATTLENVFKYIDSNGNGKIDLQKFGSIFTPMPSNYDPITNITRVKPPKLVINDTFQW